MTFDYVYTDRDGQPHYNAETDFIIDDAQMEEERLAQLYAEIKELLRQHTDFPEDDL